METTSLIWFLYITSFTYAIDNPVTEEANSARIGKENQQRHDGECTCITVSLPLQNFLLTRFYWKVPYASLKHPCIQRPVIYPIRSFLSYKSTVLSMSYGDSVSTVIEKSKSMTQMTATWKLFFCDTKQEQWEKIRSTVKCKRTKIKSWRGFWSQGATHLQAGGQTLGKQKDVSVQESNCSQFEICWILIPYCRQRHSTALRKNSKTTQKNTVNCEINSFDNSS